MDIKHFCFLSCLSDNAESHEQDGETLARTNSVRNSPASCDPAMAFEPFDPGKPFCLSTPGATCHRIFTAEAMASAQSHSLQ
jgi:hypothetical protein